MLFNTPSELKTAVLAGATGLVGKQLLYKLLESKNYSQVTALVRRPLQIKHPKLLQLEVDFDRLNEYKDQLVANDYFCCLGTTIKKAGSKDAFRKVDYTYCLEFAKIAVLNNAKKLLIITAIGSKTDSTFFYSKVKGELEETIKDFQLGSIHIFHPSLLLGNRLETRLGEQIGMILSKIFSPLLFGSLKKYKPIEATQVARAMLGAAQTQPKSKVTVYTYDEMMELQVN